MREAAFREWLEARFAPNTVSTQLSTCRRVEAAYGDLDVFYEDDRFETLLNELTYSKSDEARKKPDPSRLRLEKSIYDTLSGCRSALRTYRNFREDPVSVPVSAENALEVAGELIRERREGKHSRLNDTSKKSFVKKFLNSKLA